MKIYIGNTSVLGAVSIRRPLDGYFDEILAKTPVHFYDNVLQASILADEIHYDSWWKCPEEFSRLDFFKFESSTSNFVTDEEREKEREEFERLTANDEKNHMLMQTIDSLQEKIDKDFEKRVDEDFERFHNIIHRQLSERFDNVPARIDRKYFLPSILGLKGMISYPYDTVQELNSDLVETNKRGCYLLLNEYNAQLIRSKYKTVNHFDLQSRFFKVLQRKLLPDFSKLTAEDIIELRDTDSIEFFRDWLKSESRRIYNEYPDEHFEKETSEVVKDVADTIREWAYKTKPSTRKNMGNAVECGITNLPFPIGTVAGIGLMLYRILLSGKEHKEHYYIYFIIEINRRTK